MRNMIQDGDVITAPAPYSVNSGDAFLVGAFFAVALFSAAEGAPVEGITEGVFGCPKTPAAWAFGDRVYWDDANRVFTTEAEGHTLVGVAVEAAAANSARGVVLLDGVIRPAPAAPVAPGA
jgi:predicted RecA/RadA family phage recombinase